MLGALEQPNKEVEPKEFDEKSKGANLCGY